MRDDWGDVVLLFSADPAVGGVFSSIKAVQFVEGVMPARRGFKSKQLRARLIARSRYLWQLL